MDDVSRHKIPEEFKSEKELFLKFKLENFERKRQDFLN